MKSFRLTKAAQRTRKATAATRSSQRPGEATPMQQKGSWVKEPKEPRDREQSLSTRGPAEGQRAASRLERRSAFETP